MRSIQHRAADARAFNAANPPHTHAPAIDPNRAAKAVSQHVRTEQARTADAIKAIKQQKAHQAMAAKLDELAQRQNWGRRTASHTLSNGKHFYRHESPTHDTEVVHHGSETVVHRKHLSPPANAHAVLRASIDAMQGTWGRRVMVGRLPSGHDFHQFQDATHRTTVFHRGGEIVTHRKPHTA